MFASYRIEVASSLYSSEGGLVINNTLQLPNDKLSLHSFKTALLNSVEELLPKIWEVYLLNQELKQTLDQRLSDEASLFETEPTDDELALALPINQQELYRDDEEWQERYGRNF